MNRINQLFQKKSNRILSVYFSAGFPHLNDTVSIIQTLERKGVDLIEIGIPFSDPLADGPVIQNSSNIALKNGMSVHLLMEQLKDIRKDVKIPLIFMGYINPILHYGFENFCIKCNEIGIDGFIIPDLPMREYLEEFKETADRYNLENILLITPETSEERIREIDENTNGFIYMVSSASTTGMQKSFSGSKESYFDRINSMNLKNPRLIGFGISNRETYESACRHASGGIVGSAFVHALEQHPDDIPAAVDHLLEQLNS